MNFSLKNIKTVIVKRKHIYIDICLKKLINSLKLRLVFFSKIKKIIEGG